MGFLKSLFCRDEKCAESIVLIDISADSVAGAYVHYKEGETPALLYTQRLSIKIRKDEPHERALLAALQTLGNDLIREGAPILMRATGNGSAKTILVSVDTPWQETMVRTENFERKEPFVFTKSIVNTALEKTCIVPPDKLLADESIIGTILNGYETHDPYGKKVHRASLTVLTSLIDKTIFDDIISVLQGLYHTRHILYIAGSSLRYQMMRRLFPHEHEALILDVTGSLTSITLVRKSLFIALSEIPGAENHHSCVNNVMSEFARLAEQHPLPRTIFLLARESEISSLQHELDTAGLKKLWLSDNPPKIVPILPSHIAGSVRQTTDAAPDLQLIFMALFYQHHPPEEKV